jgi:vacuolar protein-sorting-associated protein 4
MAMNWSDVPHNRALEPSITRDDFFNALAKAKSSVDPEELKRFDKWTNQYGLEGA